MVRTRPRGASSSKQGSGSGGPCFLKWASSTASASVADLPLIIRWQRAVHVQLSGDGAKLSQHVAVVLRPPVLAHSGGKLGEFLLHAV